MTRTPSHIEYSNNRFARRQSAARKGGFTLIELLVVIAIVAIVSSLLLSGFLNISASNKRTSCQVNLQQIYGALKMYAADSDGAYPYYNATNTGTIPLGTDNGGVNGLASDTHFGLWALYTDDRISNTNPLPLDFPSTRVPDATPLDATDNPLRPVGIYLKNSGNLHCPADIQNENLYADDARTLFNPNYLSYQTIDNGAEIYSGSTLRVATYQSQRVNASADPNWRRQLMFFNGVNRIYDQRAASNTVITWCKWHRTGLGGKNSDPILFADGSVKSLSLPETALGSGQPIPGWQRQ